MEWCLFGWFWLVGKLVDVVGRVVGIVGLGWIMGLEVVGKWWLDG